MPRKPQLHASGDGPLGILGGTFDPVHYGHLCLAEEAGAALGLAEVCWIPAGVPTHRAPPEASAPQRLEMVRLAIRGNPDFRVDDSEAQCAAPSYSVPTLERMRAKVGPQRPLVLLLGADAFLGLCTWHRWRELFGLAHLGVATRPNHALAGGSMDAALAEEFHLRLSSSAEAIAAAPAGRIVPFGITALDISATAVRAKVAAGCGPRYLLPDPVLDYIATNRLYNHRD